MKFAAISTVNNIDLSAFGSINMCLAQHITGNDEYVKYFQNSDMFTIMDNGACEGSQVNVTKICELAKLINANEIVVNDVIYDGYRTSKEADRFFSDGTVDKSFQYMGVAQGRCPSEWLDCFLNLYHNENITTMGLSKLSVPRSFKEITGTDSLFVNRLYVLLQLKKLGLTDKPVHLLGLDEPVEVAVSKKFDFVRSCDSCLPVLCGSEGISLKDKYLHNLNEIRPKTKFNFNGSFNIEQEKMIIENIKTIEALTK